MAAAVILDPMRPVEGLADSKKLTPARREHLAVLIRERALAWAVAEASVEEIDRLNILQASLLAMRRAVSALKLPPEEILVDGLHTPQVAMPALAIVKGDATVAAIAAASILAKTVRDAELLRLDALYPGYGLAVHKGYPTAAHLAALQSLGVSPIHRRSYAPVKRLLATMG